MIDSFLSESDKGNKYVISMKDYITRESTLLSFKRGDIIKLVDAEIPMEDGETLTRIHVLSHCKSLPIQFILIIRA